MMPVQTVPLLSITSHAAARMQQRGIGRELVEELLRFGSRNYAPRGCASICADRNAIERARRAGAFKAARALADARGAYLVISPEGIIITVGHRLCRWRTGSRADRPQRRRPPALHACLAP